MSGAIEPTGTLTCRDAVAHDCVLDVTTESTHVPFEVTIIFCIFLRICTKDQNAILVEMKYCE